MQSLLVKIGKSYKTLRQQGLINGLRRILRYLIIFLKNSYQLNLKGDILIIGNGVGDVGHYRVFTQAEELNFHGLKTKATLQDNPFLLRFVDKFKVFILVRTLYTPKIATLIEKAKEQGKLIIFDTDDLVFDARFMHETESYAKMNALERKQYEKGVGEEIIRDPYVKTCSTTTTYLKRILESYDKQVFLSTNKISLHELEVAEKINQYKLQPKADQPLAEKANKVSIGYFSGTMSHNKDFATITEPLMEIMEKYSQVELVLVGPLETENKLNKFQDRIIQKGLASRDGHYENIASIDINLAPLVLDDPFCEAKSELKFFEAGIVKVPTVAVNNETYRGAIQDGVDGFLAGSKEEWVNKLERLILDENLRKEMGERAYEKTLKDYTVKNSHNDEYYNFLRKNITL